MRLLCTYHYPILAVANGHPALATCCRAKQLHREIAANHLMSVDVVTVRHASAGRWHTEAKLCRWG